MHGRGIALVGGGDVEAWVSSSLERLREDGVAEVTATRILIRHVDRLRALGG